MLGRLLCALGSHKWDAVLGRTGAMGEPVHLLTGSPARADDPTHRGGQTADRSHDADRHLRAL